MKRPVNPELEGNCFAVGLRFNGVHVLRAVLLSLSLSLLAACKSVPVIIEEKDRGPDQPVSVDHIREPEPKEELRTRAGNSNPYKVLGQTYYVIDNPNGYKKVGVASWYGKKFHGRRTANGEIYDMYGMTAAHKTLPIPSYVRVTNISNRRSVIVRINDRGPFHGDRIIDLSYTAAKKLGFVNKGTARVAVEYIDPVAYNDRLGKTRQGTDKPDGRVLPVNKTPQVTAGRNENGEKPAPAPQNSAGYRLPENTWLQVGAFSSVVAAEKLQKRLQGMTDYPVVILDPVELGSLYRVRVGPLKDNFDLLGLRKKVMEGQLPAPHVVYN